MGELRSASRALSVPVLNDRRSAKSTETTANDRLLYFMARPPFRSEFRRVWCDVAVLSLKYSLFSSAIASKSFLATDTSGKFTSAHKQIADSSRESGHVRKVPETDSYGAAKHPHIS
jgi:hypothetical protein